VVRRRAAVFLEFSRRLFFKQLDCPAQPDLQMSKRFSRRSGCAGQSSYSKKTNRRDTLECVNYRRMVRPGGTFFFTVVTFDRLDFLCTPLARQILRQVMEDCRRQWPFRIDALVLLPDHLHSIWTLPDGDAGYSQRWGWIKKTFTQGWLAEGGAKRAVSNGKWNEGRRGVWQPKFFEHTIRDQEDLRRHLDYIHYNPVKHGLVRCPHQWEWSSFQRWVQRDGYPGNWQCGCNGPAIERLEFDGLAVAEMD
jgi:putative transposase